MFASGCCDNASGVERIRVQDRPVHPSLLDGVEKGPFNQIILRNIHCTQSGVQAVEAELVATHLAL